MTIPSTDIRRLIALVAPNAATFDEMDGAIIGYTYVGGLPRIVYDRQTCIEIMVNEGVERKVAEKQIIDMYPTEAEQTPIIVTVLRMPGFKNRRRRLK